MYLDFNIYNNALKDWLLAFIVAAFLYLIAHIVKRVIQKRISEWSAATSHEWKHLAFQMIEKLHPIFLIVISSYFGSFYLSLSKTADKIIYNSAGVALLFQVGMLSSCLVDFYVNRYKKQKIEINAPAVSTLTSLSYIFRLLIWFLLLLIGLDNLGVNITTLIAGLGISGIAVALALQNILGDLFASLSIVLDKPFVIGDFIIVKIK